MSAPSITTAIESMIRFAIVAVILATCDASIGFAQAPKRVPDSYDSAPPAQSPYYRVRYEASSVDGELDLPVQYTVWIPPASETLRGVIVHQHGCGHWSATTGMTGAYDLHWQALAGKHDCALFSATYEIKEKEDCGRWCEPDRGSEAAFLRSLDELGKASGHPELAEVPWAMWGHSGGGFWVGTMAIRHPDRIAALWMKSGGPKVYETPAIKRGKVDAIPEAFHSVPAMLHIGTKEGLTVKKGRFASLWPYAQTLLGILRERDALFGVTVDPLTEHTSGNQRYLAIPWLDVCLEARLPENGGNRCRPMPTEESWLAELDEDLKSIQPLPKGQYAGDPASAIWLPNKSIAKAWAEYIRTSEVPDETPPPSPTNVSVADGVITWDARADLESGIRHFSILLDGQQIATAPKMADNPNGRPLYQGLSGSDTPRLPLREMRFELPEGSPTDADRYQVRAINTVGLMSAIQ